MSTHEDASGYDKETLRKLFWEMADGRRTGRGAVEIAKKLIDPPDSADPESWAEAHREEWDGKIAFIKEIRSKFGLRLKEAKSVADEVW